MREQYLLGGLQMLHNSFWDKLESEPPIGERINARLAFPDKSKKVYAGFDSNKQRHFLIILDENEEEYKDLQSKGFSIITKNLVVKGFKPKRYIDIICNDTSGYSIFDAIGEEISEKLGDNNSKEVITKVIFKWRNFLGKSPKESLSYTELIGLFAEVWFMYHWLFQKIDKYDAVNRWRGPFSSRHDFELEGKSIEVKSTTSVQSRIHKINGIEQLTPPENGKLFFFSLRLREEKGANMTLPILIESCRDILKEDIEALSKFENALAVAGYSPIHDEEYSEFKFRIVDEKLYEVTEEFPHMSPDLFINGLPSGISMIEYSINLDGYDNLCIANSPDQASVF
ncbi:MAG: PD-(D/E)XK motif protein [Candidatus Pacearchaeota archaeon]|nr:PD-(D/E)XK motif protein [Candidatus Pacearchaeota archaeon]